MRGEKRKGSVLAWIIPAVIGIAVSVAVAAKNGFSFSKPFGENARYLSDGTFTAGILIGGVGILVLISATGFFDIFAYAMRSLLVLFTPLTDPKKHQLYYEYKLAREEKRKKPERAILFVGIGFWLLAAILLFLYYQF